MSEGKVRVVRLKVPGQVDRALPCMRETITPWPDAVEDTRSCIERNLSTVINGLHLQDENGQVIGHLYFAWSEHAPIPYRIEDGVAVVLCEWVQRKHQGRGHSRQMMEALIGLLQDDAAKGIVIACTEQEECMHHRHYRKRGYRDLHVGGQLHLVYRPLAQPEISVEPLVPRLTPKRRRPVEIVIFRDAYCPFESATGRNALEVASEFSDRVSVRTVETIARSVRDLGVLPGTYVEGTRLPGGMSEEAVRRAILKALDDV